MSEKSAENQAIFGRWTFVLYGVKGPYKGQSFTITKFPCWIGRKKGCDILLVEDKAVSATHCRLDCVDKEVRVEDLLSRNGTYCNGRRITGPYVMEGRKARLKIGQTHFQLIQRPKKPEKQEFADIPASVQSGTIILSQFQNMYLPQRETLLVSDISDSTGFISTYGEKSYLRFFNAIVKLVSRYSKRHQALFVKCTGDGFLGTFEKTSEALYTAASVMDHITRLIRKYPEFASMGIRMALHRGEVAILDDGDRIGRSVHQVCRMESVQAEDRTQHRPVDFPQTNRILISREIMGDVHVERKRHIVDAGDFTLRGFIDPVRLYWVKDIQAFLSRNGPNKS